MNSRNNFIKAAGWYGKSAAILVLIFSFTFGAFIWIQLLGILNSTIDFVDLFIQLFLYAIVPIFSAWYYGGLLGQQLYKLPPPTEKEVSMIGVKIGGLSALTMFAVFELVVIATQHFGQVPAGTTSRAHVMNIFVFAYVIPICMFIGSKSSLRLLKRIKKG